MILLAIPNSRVLARFRSSWYPPAGQMLPMEVPEPGAEFWKAFFRCPVQRFRTWPGPFREALKCNETRRVRKRRFETTKHFGCLLLLFLCCDPCADTVNTIRNAQSTLTERRLAGQSSSSSQAVLNDGIFSFPGRVGWIVCPIWDFFFVWHIINGLGCTVSGS